MGSNCCSHLNRDLPNLTDFTMMGLRFFINDFLMYGIQDTDAISLEQDKIDSIHFLVMYIV